VRPWRVLGPACWVLLFWLAGCATLGPPPPAPTDGREQAASIIWQSYGRTDTLPLIRWVTGKALVCDDPNSGKRGFWIVDLDPARPDDPGIIVCREGFTWSPLELLTAYHGEKSVADTPLAHELRHVDLLRRGVILERHHDRPDFYPSVDVANQKVREAGR
jgi:hypothetical protein